MPLHRHDCFSYCVCIIYVCRLYKKLALLAFPLNKQLRKDGPKTIRPLNDRKNGTVVSLNEALIRQRMLILPKGKRYYTHSTLNPVIRRSGVLPQKQEDGGSHSVGYWSRTLNEKEPKLVTMHREHLAVVWVEALLHLYLEGTRFKNQTNYEALRWILTRAEATDKLA